MYLHKVVTGEYPLFQQYTPYSLSLAVKIREVAEQYRLDLVHVHYAIPHATSAFLAKEMLKPKRLPTMTTLHGTDITLVGMMPSYYEITRFSIEKSDAVTAVSEFLRRETVQEFRIRAPDRSDPQLRGYRSVSHPGGSWCGPQPALHRAGSGC